MSASGQYQTAATTNNIYYSMNYGATWTLSNAPTQTSNIYRSVAMSASGQYQSAGSSDNIYYSIDYGATWTLSNAPTQTSYIYISVAMSASGQYQTAATNNNIYNSVVPITSLTISGNINAASLTASSDYRIKENIQLLSDSFNTDGLKPVTYINKKTGKQDIGLIAHELQKEYPFLVSGEKDGTEMQSINYIGLIGILIKEIQDLKREVSTLSTFKKV
jgi:hypothetical protein